ncbi:MAG: hypothetical protein ACYC8S_02380 [Minisyncoccota bacterium]
MEKPPMKPAKHTPAEEHYMPLIKGILDGSIPAETITENLREAATADFTPAPLLPPSSRDTAGTTQKPHRSAEGVKSHAELSQSPRDKEL